MSCRLARRLHHTFSWLFRRCHYDWWYVAIRNARSVDVMFGYWGTAVANSVVKDTGYATIAVEPRDSKGEPVELIKPLEWSVADPSIATLKPSDSGLSCEVWPATPFKAGSTTVTATDPAHPHLAIQAWGFTFATGDVARYDSTVTVADDAAVPSTDAPAKTEVAAQ